MTPNRRLDQLESLMADVLQKIDRLIEGQGQLVEVTTNTKVELDEVKSNLIEVKGDLVEVKGDLIILKEIVTKVDATGQITANGLANLTVSSQKQFEQLKTGLEELRSNQELLKAGQDAIMNYLLKKLP